MKKETIVKIVLCLSEEEALWLHDIMQNPLHGQQPSDEDPYDRDMREQFFAATGKS